MNEVKEGVHAWADDIVDTFAEFSSPKSYKSIKIGGNDAYTKKQKRRGKVSSEYKAKRKKYEFAASVPCSVSPPWSPQACMTASMHPSLLATHDLGACSCVPVVCGAAARAGICVECE